MSLRRHGIHTLASLAERRHHNLAILTTWAAVNIMDSRTILRMGGGFDIGIIMRALLKSLYRIQRDRQNAGSCELYYKWNSVTSVGKRYLLPKTIHPRIIAMVTFATATIAGQRLSVLPENENPAGRRRRPFQH